MLDHTVKRLIETIPNFVIKDQILTLLSKVGFDGQSGLCEYNVKNQCEFDFSSIMHSALVPLKLTESSEIIWQNSTPNSVHYCRPFRICWQKDHQ